MRTLTCPEHGQLPCAHWPNRLPAAERPPEACCGCGHQSHVRSRARCPVRACGCHLHHAPWQRAA